MIDRQKGPKINKIDAVTLPLVEHYRLANGIPVYSINQGYQDVVKLDISFWAGRPYESKKMTSKATALMLREGTTENTSREIAEFFDFYGASLSCRTGLDTASVTLHSMTQYMDQLMPKLLKILNNATFPKEELEKTKTKIKQRLLVDSSKNDIIAYRNLTEKIYGTSHAYGYNSTAENVDNVVQDDVLNHYANNYTSDNCIVFISGKVTSKVKSLIHEYIGSWDKKGSRSFDLKKGNIELPQSLSFSSENSYQAALRMGKNLFNRKNPDYGGMHFLTTLLGGYFGSRLMRNIREDKGYTYNIYAGMDMMIHDGYFFISTDVAKEYVERTFVEIEKEIGQLQKNLVPQEEMEMVRNYLLGNYLTYLDGAFNVAQLVKTMVLSGLELEKFDQQIHTIKHISPEEIKQLANQYLSTKDMWKVVVGNI